MNMLFRNRGGKDVQEPTTEAIDRCVVVPGVHKFRVTQDDLSKIRGRLYAAQARSGQGSMMGNYDKRREVLTVEIFL